ncbi:MAG: acetoacetate decarboxylase family protein [Aphanocapsa lilacina HA4352-LM1]|jgi:hypothetical protein|nr:acetoacetate decarboxylase family protein [Aphanocapsa lilacina HA4352-LM1]
MIDQLFSGLRNLSLPDIGVPGTGTPSDPSLDVPMDDPELVMPPWQVGGQAALELAQFPVEAVRPFVPAGLEILQTWPGYTLGTVAFIAYDESPIGPYNELVIAPALVRSGDVISQWVAVMDVDSEVSRRNGRFQWGLPKQLRTFEYTWQPGRADFAVRRAPDLSALVTASCTEALPLHTIDLPEWLSGVRDALQDLSVPLQFGGLNLITYKSGTFLRTAVHFEGGAAAVRFEMRAEAPDESPYHLLQLRQPLVGLRFERFSFNLAVPTPIV